MNAFNERKTAAAGKFETNQDCEQKKKKKEKKKKKKRVRSSHDLSRCLSLALQYPVRLNNTILFSRATRHATCQTFTQSLLQRQVLKLSLL